LVGSRLCGIANLEESTGSAFAALFRRWSIALYASGLAPPAAAPAQTAGNDGFVSVRLRGASDEWELAGPRFTRMTPGDAVHEWSALGTTTHYVVIDGSHSPFVEVEVSGPRDAELQVTALPLGSDLARLDLYLQKTCAPGKGLAVRARVREGHGVPVRLSAMSWEPLVPGSDPSAAVSQHGRLLADGIAPMFGTASLPARGELVSSPIPLTGVSPDSGPIVVKVVGSDAGGRRVAAWAQLELQK
jgi:hypothetical protein